MFTSVFVWAIIVADVYERHSMMGDLVIQVSEKSAYVEAFMALHYGWELYGDAAQGIAQQILKSKRPLSKPQMDEVRRVVDKYRGENVCHLGCSLELDDLERHLDDGYCSVHGARFDKND